MKALLFDMDGTMLDSMGMWLQLEMTYLEDLGVNVEEVNVDEIMTYSLTDLANYLQDQHQISVTEEHLGQLIEDHVLDYYRHDSKLFAGVKETLEAFQEMGIPMAVGTATKYEYARVGLEHCQILDYFDFVHSISISDYSKHEPGFYKEAAEKFQLAPEELVLFDDVVYALTAAKEAGLYVVAIEDLAYEQDTEKMKEIADLYLEGFEDFDPQPFAREVGLQ